MGNVFPSNRANFERGVSFGYTQSSCDDFLSPLCFLFRIPKLFPNFEKPRFLHPLGGSFSFPMDDLPLPLELKGLPWSPHSIEVGFLFFCSPSANSATLWTSVNTGRPEPRAFRKVDTSIPGPFFSGSPCRRKPNTNGTRSPPRRDLPLDLLRSPSITPAAQSSDPFVSPVSGSFHAPRQLGRFFLSAAESR